MNKKSGLLGLLLLFLFASADAFAFRSLKVDGYTDPDYTGFKPKKVVLLVLNATNEMRSQIEAHMVERMERRGVNVVPYRSLFPPTRQWTQEQQLEIYEREKVDSGLIVTVGASASSVIPFATQTYNSSTVFGSYGSNGTFNANGSGTSTSYMLLNARSRTDFSAVLLDLAKNRAIWYADIATKAQGALFVGSRGDAKAAVNGILRGLSEKNHLVKR